MKKKATDSAEFTVNNGLLKVRVLNGQFMNPDQLTLNRQVRLEMVQDQPVRYLADVSCVEDISFDTIQSLATGLRGSQIVAVAILCSTTQLEIAARQGKKLVSADVPLKAFRSREIALEWLERV